MIIQVRTDNHIDGGADLNSYVESNLSEQFSRYKNAITRIEVHLSDVNASKTTDNDKRCLLEARIANRQPVVVSHNANTIHQAIEVAADKLLRSLDSMVGKLTDHTSPKDLLVDETKEDEDSDF